MKYESELIQEILEAEGHKSSSLHYESECIEEWLESVRGAYPKLCDYEGEWINYYLNNGGIGVFPYEAITNVTDASIHRTVPIPFKRAILKGQTLVNLYKANTTKSSSDSGFYFVNTIPSSMIKSNTYTIINTTNKKLSIAIRSISSNAYARNIEIDALTKIAVTLSDDEWIRFFIASTSNGWVNGDANDESMLKKMVVVEGDYTNVNIPYFEGIQSVKVPVLTTTGKNLFDKSTVKYNTTIQTYGVGREVADNNYMVSDFIEVKPNTTYTSNYMGVILYYDENRKFIGALDDEVLPQNFTTPNNCKHIRIRCWERYNTIEKQREIVELEQLEENSIATAFEPYQSNILTVNEDVTLRSNGSVYDELDLLTGKLTQRIGEVVLDGSENWSADIAEFTNTCRFHLKIDDIVNRQWGELINNPPFVKSNTFRSLDL